MYAIPLVIGGFVLAFALFANDYGVLLTANQGEYLPPLAKSVASWLTFETGMVWLFSKRPIFTTIPAKA